MPALSSQFLTGDVYYSVSINTYLTSRILLASTMSSVHTITGANAILVTFTPNACGSGLPATQCIVPMENGIHLVWTDIPATITQAGTNVPLSTMGTVLTMAIISS